jgi:hypothetical protein
MLLLAQSVASVLEDGPYLFNLSVQSSNGKVDSPGSELNLCSIFP